MYKYHHCQKAACKLCLLLSLPLSPQTKSLTKHSLPFSGMNSGVGGSRVPIPSSVRKTIQNIREITGKQHSDHEIYAVLKECYMDPNETAQKLLYLGIFLLNIILCRCKSLLLGFLWVFHAIFWLWRFSGLVSIASMNGGFFWVMVILGNGGVCLLGKVEKVKEYGNL